MGMDSARYCAPQGSCLLFLSPTAVLAAVPKSSSMPGSQLKLLVGTSITLRHLPSFLMSICGPVYCLKQCQSGPSPSPLLSKAISCVCCFIFMFRKYLCICTNAHVFMHTLLAPSHRQVIMAGGKILPREHSLPQAQLYNRLRCVYAVCSCVCTRHVCCSYLHFYQNLQPNYPTVYVSALQTGIQKYKL